MGELKPHQSRYWLNSNPKDEKHQQVKEVCQTYEDAPKLFEEEGTHTVCVDEKTNIQALERLHPTKPMCKGQVEKREHEYIRHGTQVLTANFEVATGEIIAPTISETRTEEEFAEHIKQTINTDPDAKWVFVCDNLNTHCSATLVILLAGLLGIPSDTLGKKETRGVLKSMRSRKDFLSDKSHRIRFVYTPNHSSWLNQVEIWFSVLTRRLIKRGNFRSKEELKDGLLKFIDYFNKTLARPYKWTCKGRPLNV